MKVELDAYAAAAAIVASMVAGVVAITALEWYGSLRETDMFTSRGYTQAALPGTHCAKWVKMPEGGKK